MEGLSETQIRDFMEHSVWKVFHAEMLEMRRIVMETMVSEMDVDKIRLHQGRAEVLQDLASWPEIQLSIFNNDKKDDKLKEE